jgi:anti-anti-sigma regulatory factor
MNVSLRQVQGSVPVTVLGIEGALDASNYQDLIAEATEVHSAGANDLLLDLSNTSFLSSSGLVALHSIALLMRGAQVPAAEEGWGAIRAVHRGLGSGVEQHVKLLSPQPQVERTLQKAGLIEFFEIHRDLDAAVASF